MKDCFYPQLVIPESFDECFTYELQLLWLHKKILELEGNTPNLNEINESLQRLQEQVNSKQNIVDTKAEMSVTINGERKICPGKNYGVVSYVEIIPDELIPSGSTIALSPGYAKSNYFPLVCFSTRVTTSGISSVARLATLTGYTFTLSQDVRPNSEKIVIIAIMMNPNIALGL